MVPLKKLICCTISTIVVYISAQKVVINNVGNVRSLTFFKKISVWIA